MPIQTDLSVSPYFDDFNETKDFYKVLFRPGVAVQVRELNQLQSILQKQIERFGDNIYKKGTIIDGCNFVFYNPLPYVKINDSQTDSAPVNVSSFDSYLVKNSANLVARIVKTIPGYEATAPDLNTLYVKYVSGGQSGNSSAFTPGEILTVYDPALGLSSCTEIITKSSGFSNTDTAILVSAVVVQNSIGGRSFVNATGQACTFVVGDIITQEVTNARAEIRDINTTDVEGQTVLSIRPLASELRMANVDSWTFKNGLSFTTSSSKITAKIVSSVGQGATASIITDSAGGILSYAILNPGAGYKVPPYATVFYSTPNTNPSANVLIDALDIRAKNYKTRITVNSALDSVGNGYGFGVSAGVIYQKGYFSRVDEQFVVVEKYTTVTNKTVGFDTAEEIVDYKKDFTLLDNASGTLNVNAPGSNRLKLTPKLIVLNKTEAAANDQFFPIVEFSQGKAYRRNTPTFFNSIAKELAQRTYEQSGNYVTDGFLTATLSDTDFKTEPYNFQIRIDPGVGYINGYRAQYYENFYQYNSKGINTESSDTKFSVNYGNYITVNELGGIFKFSVGATVSLYDTAKTYLTSSAKAGSFDNITPAGNEIGKARIRSLVLVSGVAGEPNAKYNMYLFDIKMNTGKNFESVASVYYDQNGNDDGIADLVLIGGKAVIFDPQNSFMIYKPGSIRALKSADNINYTYRTIRSDVACNTQGYITVSVAQNLGEVLPYQSTLSDLQKLSLIVTPAADAICANSLGTVKTIAACTYVIGSATRFDQTFEAGDYVRIANSTAAEIKRVTAIVNSSVMLVSGEVANAFSSANISLIFPKNVPIPLYQRDNRIVTVEANKTLSIYLGNTISSAVNTSVVFESNRTINNVAKTVTRNVFVKINTATNQANNTGPWCLGIPDIIRLNRVYLGTSTSVTTSDLDITDNFWIDHNQRKEYYDVGYLYKNSKYTLPENAVLLIDFDILSTSQNGLKTISSYPIDDTKKLSESVDTINTVEIPEMFLDNDQYFDLRDTFDFRPYTTNTCAISTSYTNAPINPSEPTFDTRFDLTTDKKFPAPKSECSAIIQTYKGRIDAITMSPNSQIKVTTGKPGDNPVVPEIAKDGLLINYLIIPPYPSLPKGLSQDYSLFLNRRISNIHYTNKRQLDYSIRTSISSNNISSSQPQRYTMADIANLERRIADLEYYTSLNMLESSINNISIPSSISSNIAGTSDRFKFGYFADDFTTVDYAQLNDPNYSAQIYGYQLHPAKTEFNIKYNFNLNDANTVQCIKGTKVILPSHRKTLISQNIATESTTMEVAITETVTSVTGTEVITTTSKKVEISSTSFTDNPRQILTSYANSTVTNSPENYNTVVGQTFAETVTQTKPYGHTNTPTGNFVNSSWIGQSFNVSKLGGTITAGGILREDSAGIRAPYPKLQQYKNGVWIDVATAGKGLLYDDRDGSGNIRLSGYDLTKMYVIQSGTATDWAIDYTVSADKINTLYRLVGGGSPNGSLASSITRGTYPQSTDVVIYNIKNADGSITSTRSVPIYETQYTTTNNTVVTTRIEQLPKTTIVETPTTITQNIFNPKLTGQMAIDNIFATSSSLNDPFVDLAKYIQSQINA